MSAPPAYTIQEEVHSSDGGTWSRFVVLRGSEVVRTFLSRRKAQAFVRNQEILTRAFSKR